MIEKLQYKRIDELKALSLAELQALWELVPTERQRAYRSAYDREVRNAGAIGSDDLERRVAAELLERYRDSALVPVGSRWARTPQRVQDAARDNEMPDLGDHRLEAGSGQTSPKMKLAIGALLVVFVAFMLLRLSGGGGSGEMEIEGTVEASITPTPEVSPTPTPLALEAQDDVITDGDADRAVAYPVNLQVVLADGGAPRVWVVQRREVRAAQWNFDPNPDIASFVNGMSVRPVIGIPWSEDNAELFSAMREGAVFNLTMNTGAILRYEFAAKSEVLRSDTRIFRQVGPGLVLLLIGETDGDGLPTGTRTLVTASYPPEQELSRSGEVLGLSGLVQDGEVGSSLTLGDAGSVLLRQVSARDEGNSGQQSLTFDFDVIAGERAVDTGSWRLELLDDGGQVYLPAINRQEDVSYGGLPIDIPALAQIPVSMDYLVPVGFTGGRLLISDGRGGTVSFRFALEMPEVDLDYGGVDVRLVSVSSLEGQITTQLRIYNGQVTPITLTQDDIWLALGYAPDPPGPRNPAEGLQPFTLQPEQAVDLTLVWYWGGEPFGALQVGSYRFAIQLTR
ncbi:MAG: hypothetical protein RIC84_25300 [Aggregatilineales bacterium]